MKYAYNKKTGQLTSFTEVINPVQKEPLIAEIARLDEEISKLQTQRAEVESKIAQYDEIVLEAKDLGAKDDLVEIIK